MAGRRTDTCSGLTRVEVLVIIGAVALLIACLLPALARARVKVQRIRCVCNQKQIGLSFKIWAGDHFDKYPMQVVATNNGTIDWVASGEAWPHFQVLSNELNTPRVLVCPADKRRKFADNFVQFGNTNLSYFVGVDATEENPQTLLAGDGNLEIDGQPVPSGLLNLWSNAPVGWTEKQHHRCGNVAMGDGSTQQYSNPKLREQLVYSGVATNRLAMP